MKRIVEASKVGFLIHTFGPIEPKVYFNHVGTMMSWSKRCNMFFCGIDKHRSAQARNILVETSLAAECTHLIVIDADHIVPDHMLECLSLNEDADIVSGLVTRRRPPFTQVGFVMLDGVYRNIDLPVDGRSYIVDVPAMGATMFDAEVFKIIKKPWFVDIAGIDLNGDVYNKRSDTNFFEHARDAGFKMSIDTRVEIGHVGDPRVYYPSTRVACSEMNKQGGVRMSADSLTWQAPVYEKARRLVDDGSVKTILDLGCGNPIKLKDIDASIVGIDLSEKITEISRCGVDGEWIGADLNKGFDLQRKFDLIIAADVIEHLDSVDVFFDVIDKHLIPGGRLLMSSPEASTTRGDNILHVQEFTDAELLGIIAAHSYKLIESMQYEEIHDGEASYLNNVFLVEK